ncbi:hypothetical protein KY333_00020 [Candidatus Woesearchaeota archaeon]|nr:hypothetical protein [Candidatus Woesearchaeota archaeon]
MGIEKFVPRTEELESIEVIEGVIVAVYPHSTNPVLVQLDGYNHKSEIPKYSFACSSDDLDEVTGGRKIKYYRWTTKKGLHGELIDLLPEPKNTFDYEDGDTEVAKGLYAKDIQEFKEDAELEKSIDEAIDQIDDLKQD